MLISVSVSSQPDGVETFSQFLRTEFSEENIEFWLACEEYKTIDSDTKLLSKAKYIYTVFIESDAPKEVRHGVFIYRQLLGCSVATYYRIKGRFSIFFICHWGVWEVSNIYVIIIKISVGRVDSTTQSWACSSLTFLSNCYKQQLAEVRPSSACTAAKQVGLFL